MISPTVFCIRTILKDLNALFKVAPMYHREASVKNKLCMHNYRHALLHALTTVPLPSR